MKDAVAALSETLAVYDVILGKQKFLGGDVGDAALYVAAAEATFSTGIDTGRPVPLILRARLCGEGGGCDDEQWAQCHEVCPLLLSIFSNQRNTDF
jgi:hypothetical protein